MGCDTDFVMYYSTYSIPITVIIVVYFCRFLQNACAGNKLNSWK